MMILLESWVQDAISGSMLLAIPVAMLAGLASFASPCVLPLLPAYLSFATGLGAAQISEGTGHRRTLLLGTLGFVLGFAVVFVLTGAVLGGLGALLLAYQRPISVVVGVLTIVLGAVFAGIIRFDRTAKMNYAPEFGVAASPVLGAVFALGWTPCIGPALAAVLSLSISEASVARGATLAGFYALGLGLPFIAFGLAFGRLTPVLRWAQRHQRGLQLAGGIMLMLVGVALVTGLWELLMNWLQVVAARFGAPL